MFKKLHLEGTSQAAHGQCLQWKGTSVPVSLLSVPIALSFGHLQARKAIAHWQECVCHWRQGFEEFFSKIKHGPHGDSAITLSGKLLFERYSLSVSRFRSNGRLIDYSADENQSRSTLKFSREAIFFLFVVNWLLQFLPIFILSNKIWMKRKWAFSRN